MFAFIRSSQWFNQGGTIWLKNLTICVFSNHTSHQIPTLLVKMRPVTREMELLDLSWASLSECICIFAHFPPPPLFSKTSPYGANGLKNHW